MQLVESTRSRRWEDLILSVTEYAELMVDNHTLYPTEPEQEASHYHNDEESEVRTLTVLERADAVRSTIVLP